MATVSSLMYLSMSPCDGVEMESFTITLPSLSTTPMAVFVPPTSTPIATFFIFIIFS